jgi:hypothetical protein
MPRTLDKRIEAIDVDDGSKIVLLRPGWRYGDEGNDEDRCHSFGADTNREIRLEMKNVKPCSCRDCQKALESSGRLWS